MRRLSILIALIAATAFAGTAVAASRLQSFGTGDVTIDGDAATLINEAGEFSGVYLKSRSQSGKPLAAVHVSFDYEGSTAGGAPRFSIPLDTGATESVTPYAFVDALNCGSTGTVDTDASNCQVFLNFSNESFANWDAFAAAHPTWRIAPGSIPFIIADQPGTYEISNVDLR
jgi:hypothetical protein